MENAAGITLTREIVDLSIKLLERAKVSQSWNPFNFISHSFLHLFHLNTIVDSSAFLLETYLHTTLVSMHSNDQTRVYLACISDSIRMYRSLQHQVCVEVKEDTTDSGKRLETGVLWILHQSLLVSFVMTIIMLAALNHSLQKWHIQMMVIDKILGTKGITNNTLHSLTLLSCNLQNCGVFCNRWVICDVHESRCSQWTYNTISSHLSSLPSLLACNVASLLVTSLYFTQGTKP